MDTATSTSASPVISCAEKNRRLSLLGGTSEGRQAVYRQSVEDSTRFWSHVARKEFVWKTYWPDDQNVCSYNFDKTKGPVFVKWFEGGLTNVCYNAVDRHAEQDKNRVCFYWEGNDPKKKETITYGEMQERVIRCANVLRSQYGIQKGDVVAMYLPMIPFTMVCMMACARIGAVPLVVFAGFSSEALAARLQAGHPKLLITADASFRGNKRVPLQKIVDEALGYLSNKCPPGGSTTPSSCSREEVGVPAVRSTSSKTPRPTSSFSLPCLVFPNEGRQQCHLRPGRDVWYDDAEQRLTAEERRHCPIEWVDAEHMLFILYTSGSTGRPKAVVHTTGGYMVYSAATFRYVFDYHPDDIYFCTGDIGWITGHSYGLYGPMLNGATSVLFEGIFNYPTLSRWWELVETYKVTLFYTAPTALRLLRKFGDAPLHQHDLSSLRVLGSVGEPMNTETWQWYYEVVGRKKVDIVDTYWQTETGGHMLTGLPGCTPMKPGCTGLPFLGVRPVLLDHKTFTVLEGKNASGLLAMSQPWPGICRTLLGEHEKYEQLYFSHNGYFLTGDGARRDEDAYYWITGRVDDVLNVSGHRLGTSEIEDAVTSHPSVVECAVVGVPHDIKGESVYVYFTPRPQVTVTTALMEEIKQTVRHRIGPLASPDGMHPAPDGLPKTRSGKIVRRMLRKIAMKKDDELGDVSTLMDPKVVPALIAARKKWVEKKAVEQKGKL